MEVVAGAMGSLLPKLRELLLEEYHLDKRVKKDVESVSREMKSMHAALRKVADVPRDQLDEQLLLWADHVRELSYKMEDVVDKFLVSMEDPPPATDNSHMLRRLMGKMAGFFKKGKTRRQTSKAIRDINNEVQELANRRGRYTIDNTVVSKPAAIDPRLRALYTEVKELIGIDGKRDQELIKLLSLGNDDDASKKKLKIVSVCGFGGLGKTTLARAVYSKIKAGFDCWAFVPVGRNPDVKKVLRDILIDFGNSVPNLMILDERQLIEVIRAFLKNKRYLLIIDDIWDEKLWEVIKLAFTNGDSPGSRLITTTRIVSVSKACCSSTDDMVYEMKPLCDSDSQMLFYKRIFSHECGCPSELKQVSKEILKKCGGVPLAIITLASLLASDQYVKSKDEWQNLLQSIGRGLTEDASLQEMQRILSFSYYDLPSHLKSCLLYLSIYPEDYSIQKNQLIWKWVAESFVQCREQGTNLFELGESYFNELVNRSMVQPICNDIGVVEACCVHDMVLDLICLLSSEENFVNILDCSRDIMSSRNNVRRLSIQIRNEDLQGTHPIHSVSMSQVRSITVFTPAITDIMSALLRFEFLRVLDLSYCDLRKSNSQLINLRDVGNLVHLRYLGLLETGIHELPAEIGNLQFLQVLDVGDNDDLGELPSTVCKLRRLMCLNLNCEIPPGVLRNLASLEVLTNIFAFQDVVQELRNLPILRELGIVFNNDYTSDDTEEAEFARIKKELEEAFVESLCDLHSIRCLSMHGDFDSMDLLGERWLPHRHLRRFDSYDAGEFSALLPWIKRDSSHLMSLSELSIRVNKLEQGDLQILGMLPALRRLLLGSTHQTQRLLVVGADGFESTVSFELHCGSGAQIVFEQGALPKAEQVTLCLGVRVAKEDGNGDFDLGLQGNLLSLRQFHAGINWRGAMVVDAEKAEAAVRHALHDHPNHPTITSYMFPPIPKATDLSMHPPPPYFA